MGEVRIGGRRDRNIRINLVPAKMAAYGVAAQDINNAFGREHIQLAGGFLVGRATEHLVKIDLEFHKLDDLAAMIVGYKDGAPVRLRDIAEIEDGLTDNRQLARLNGRPAVGVGIVKVPNTNTVEIIDRVLERVERDVRPQLPPGLELHIVQSDKLFIGAMVDALKMHLVEGTILAALIVWLFLKSFRSTVIIACSIPVSLMGAIAVMYFFGYTFNSVTLLALLLLVGVVVDDAIVVLENIYRHREEDRGTSAVQAAVTGSREVTFAVIAASFSLVAIFAPVVFVSGILGQFLRSFAVVVTFGVLVSLFVSLTLTPMLCARYLEVSERHGKVYWALEHFFDRIDGAYRRMLGWALGNHGLVLGLAVLFFALAIPLFQGLPRELAPQADEGRFLVGIRTPLGSSIDYTESKLREVEAIAKNYPEIVTEFGVIGLGSSSQVNQATLVVRMKPRHERERSQAEVINSFRGELQQVAGRTRLPARFRPGAGSALRAAAVRGQGPEPAGDGRHAAELQRVLQADPQIGRMDTDLQLDLPQLILEPDRVRAAGLNLTSGDVALAVSMLTGGIDIAKYNDYPGDGERYDIRVKAKDGEFQQQVDLSKIYLRNSQGQLVRLDQVARFREALGPAVISRFDLQYSATFYATPSVSLGAAIEKVRAAGAKPADRLPRGVRRRGRAAGEDRRGDAVHLPARPRAALHGARQPVQQLPAAALHHAGGAARHRRRRRRAVALRQHAQHLFRHRPGAADRPGGEELDPAGRPDQPAPRAGHERRRRAARRLPDAHATGGHDLAHHHPRAHAGGHRRRRRRRNQRAAVARRDRRHDHLHAAHPGRRPRGLFRGGELARAPPRRKARRRRGAPQGPQAPRKEP